MQCWDSFLDGYQSPLLAAPRPTRGLDDAVGSAIEEMRRRGCYYLRPTGQSMKMYCYALNIADTMLFNPE